MVSRLGWRSTVIVVESRAVLGRTALAMPSSPIAMGGRWLWLPDPRGSMPRFRVVIADFVTDELRPERETLADIADIVALDANSEQDLAGPIDDADAVMLYHNIILSKDTIS